MAVTGIGTYASYTNSYGNTQNAGNKTGRTYKNAHEYKNYLTQKYDCLRSRDYSVNINSSLLSEAMGDEKTKQWLEYNLSLIHLYNRNVYRPCRANTFRSVKEQISPYYDSRRQTNYAQNTSLTNSCV